MSRSLGRNIFVPTILVFSFIGCATDSPQVQPLSATDSRIVQAPFDAAWQATKAALREQDYILFTRDKRGFFEAYTEERRKLIFPRRSRLSVTLVSVSSTTTRVTVETVEQKYQVSLLTYPGWHEGKDADSALGLALLDAVEAQIAVDSSS